MKILHLLPHYHPFWGGLAVFLRSFVHSLQARGHYNVILTSHLDTLQPDNDQVDGIPVHRVPYITGLTDRNPGNIIQSKLRAAQIKKNVQPDLIHVHVGGPFVALHTMTENAWPVPLVATVYDLPPDGQVSESTRQILLKAQRVAAISEPRLAEARLLAPEAADRMELIYVSKPPLASLPARQPAPHPLFLMVGRQVYDKGFDLAIEAFAQVLPRYPQAELVLVGKGPVHDALAAQVRRLGLQNAVRLPGRLSDEDLAALTSMAWAALVPSRHSESFGLVALEAMQAGVPVIASHTGGLPEVVPDGVAGLLFPSNDSGALAQTMLRLLDDPLLARSLSQAAYERAHTVFDWNACLASHEKMYHKALGL
jgi:glycogen synthase